MTEKVAENYHFFAGFLRFVADKTDKSDPAVHAMMAELVQAAGQIESGPNFQILASRAHASSRAFAGVAQFLQHRILPEAQAHGNSYAIAQIQWAIAAALQIGRAAILHLDGIEESQLNQRFIDLKLPPLDRIAGQHSEKIENKQPSALH